MTTFGEVNALKYLFIGSIKVHKLSKNFLKEYKFFVILIKYVAMKKKVF